MVIYKICETLGAIFGLIMAYTKNLIYVIGLVYTFCTLFDKEFSWIAVAIIYASLTFVYIPIRNYLHRKVEEQLKILDDGTE